jgi:hypothetical protein
VNTTIGGVHKIEDVVCLRYSLKPTLRYREARLHPLRSREATSQVGSDFVASDQSQPVFRFAVSPTLGLFQRKVTQVGYDLCMKALCIIVQCNYRMYLNCANIK